jgi:hypothetical protein
MNHSMLLCGLLYILLMVNSVVCLIIATGVCVTSVTCVKYLLRDNKHNRVAIATGCRLDGRGVSVRVPVGTRFLPSPHLPDRFWGPPSLLSNGYGGVRRPGREADHSPTSAEV